jgi:hypothetical protein
MFACCVDGRNGVTHNHRSGEDDGHQNWCASTYTPNGVTDHDVIILPIVTVSCHSGRNPINKRFRDSNQVTNGSVIATTHSD